MTWSDKPLVCSECYGRMVCVMTMVSVSSPQATSAQCPQRDETYRCLSCGWERVVSFVRISVERDGDNATA